MPKDVKCYGAFEISGCPIAEHRIIREGDDEYSFKHADDSDCLQMRKMQWYELQDTMEPMKLFSS